MVTIIVMRTLNPIVLTQLACVVSREVSSGCMGIQKDLGMVHILQILFPPCIEWSETLQGFLSWLNPNFLTYWYRTLIPLIP